MMKSMIFKMAKKRRVMSRRLEVILRATKSTPEYPPNANMQKTNKKLNVEEINPNLAFVRK